MERVKVSGERWGWGKAWGYGACGGGEVSGRAERRDVEADAAMCVRGWKEKARIA